MAADFSPGYQPFDYRWSALALRKRATTKRFRAAAVDQRQYWGSQNLPRRRALSGCLSKSFEKPGVYAIYDDKFPIYVGETRNVRQRVERIIASDMWARFNPNFIRVWEVDQELEQFGLRSFLVCRDKPLLNSDLLLNERE